MPPRHTSMWRQRTTLHFPMAQMVLPVSASPHCRPSTHLSTRLEQMMAEVFFSTCSKIIRQNQTLSPSRCREVTIPLEMSRDRLVLVGINLRLFLNDIPTSWENRRSRRRVQSSFGHHSHSYMARKFAQAMERSPRGGSCRVRYRRPSYKWNRRRA